MLTGVGQSSLPQACPVCLHEPVKADDCRPNKALRTTIKVFLRKKGIEREAARKKELVDKAAITPAPLATSQVDATTSTQRLQDHAKSLSGGETAVDGTPSAREVSHVSQSVRVSNMSPAPPSSYMQEQMDIPRPSIEVRVLSRIDDRGLLTMFSLLAIPKRQGCMTKVWE